MQETPRAPCSGAEKIDTTTSGNYASVPDFIYGITREIWEDRGIGGKIQKYYADDCLVRAATGITTDNLGVTAQTLQTLHQFPDRQLVGEDVIWHGYDGRLFPLLASAHFGDAASGQPASTARPTGRSCARASSPTADRQRPGQGGMARPRPGGLRALHGHRSRRHGAGHRRPRPAPHRRSRLLHAGAGLAERLLAPEIQEGRRLDAYCDGWTQIWDVKETARNQGSLLPWRRVVGPGRRQPVRTRGHRPLRHRIPRFVSGRALDDRERHRQSRSGPARPRCAMRWALRGTHSGFGHFGEPTGAAVYVMGLSHAHLVDGRITQEWIVTDEVSIWKQIFAHAAATTGANAFG